MPKKKAARSRGRPPKEPSPFAEKPRLTPKKWRGLERELLGIKDQFQSDDWPSELHAVATAAGVTERAVRQWRDDDPEYLRGLGWLMAAKLTERLDRGDPEQSEPTLTEKQRAGFLHVFVKRNWTGPVQSPIDKKVYSSIDDYVAHLLNHHDVVPYDGSVKKKSE